jgi:hypothetical protein
MAKSLRKESTFSFPRGPLPLVEAAKEAERALAADYELDVADVVLELKNMVDKGELATSVLLDKALERAVEKHPRTTYTHRAMLGVVASKNREAAFDEGAKIHCDDEIPWADLAFYAMKLDVIEGLEAAGVDVSELGPAGDDDDDSDDADSDDSDAEDEDE